MTKEEAIQELQNCIGLIQQDGQDYLDDRDIPLLNTAIEALQFADKSPRTVKLTMADRPKSEWIKKQVFNPELDKYVPLIECSVCGYEPYFGGSESKFNYCANCGARMEK